MTSGTRRAGESLHVRGKLDSDSPNPIKGTAPFDALNDSPRTGTVSWYFVRR